MTKLPDITVLRGADATFCVNVMGTPPPIVTWCINGYSITSHDKDNVIVTRTGQKHQLTMRCCKEIGRHFVTVEVENEVGNETQTAEFIVGGTFIV